MVRKIFTSILLITLFLVQINAQNVFERHCISCHKKLPASLQEIFKHYLLVYSGENNVKAGIKHYLRYPSSDITVMSKLFIDTYGIKHKSQLSPKALKEAVDIYWEKYKVFGKLY